MRLLRTGIYSIDSVIPEVVVCSPKETQEARAQGLPYIEWSGSNEELICCILYPYLKKILGGINVEKALGLKQYKSVYVNMPSPSKPMVDWDDNEDFDDKATESLAETREEREWSAAPLDVSPSATGHVTRDDAESEETWNYTGDGHNECYGGEERDPDRSYHLMDFDVWASYLHDCINIEELGYLRVLPEYIGNIQDVIRHNLGNSVMWRQGYNKKLGIISDVAMLAGTGKNLGVFDVSHSMGEVGTQSLTLVGTMREQCHMDLIITGGISKFFPYGTDLPTPAELRNMIPKDNERFHFKNILRSLAGKEYDHVVSFGDNDSCGTCDDLPTIVVKEVHHFFRDSFYRRGTSTGYARWCKEMNPSVKEHFNNEWSKYAK